MYKPVIEMVSQTVMEQTEDAIIKAVISQDIRVDKEELIRALRYDRGQYEQGFRDGVASVNEWKPVSDPPKETGSTLICTATGAVCTAKYYAGSGTWNGYAGKNAAYWMPLPQPPKGVE